MARGTVDVSAFAQRLRNATDQQSSALAEAQQAERDFATAYAQREQDRVALHGSATRAAEAYSQVVRWIGEQQRAVHSIELARGGIFAKTRAK